MTARHVLTDVFLWLGVGLELIACLGVVVMRGTFERLHFSGPAVLGASAIAVAVVIKDSFSLVGDKAILIAVFLLIVSPILTHATARASRMGANGDWRPAPGEQIEIEEP